MPDPTRSPSARALGLVLVCLLLLSVLLPAVSALDVSVRAIKVRGSNQGDNGYSPHTVENFEFSSEGEVKPLDGSGVGIAVLDTGVDDGHPTFEGAGPVRGAELMANGDWRERDPLTGECWNPDDSNPSGHGTHVASIALGRGAQGSTAQTTVHRGVAPGASLVDVKITNDLGSTDTNRVAEGIRWVMRYNAGQTECVTQVPVKVIVLSIGTIQPHDEQEYDRAMEAVRDATSAGILVVVAAGNCGPGDGDVAIPCSGSDGQRDTITSPGAAPEALTVGAVEDPDPQKKTVTRNQDRVAGYSSRGPGPAESSTDERWRKPDVVAPGTNIRAACNSLTGQEGRPDAVCSLTGTSMAAPHVGGLAAILFQALELSGEEATPQRVKELITSTAEDWSLEGSGTNGWDKDTGYGYVDGYAAVVKAVNRAPKAVFSFSPLQVDAGSEVTFDASKSEDPDPQDAIVRYIWDFGDGSEPVEMGGETPVAHHVYGTPDTYEVTLTVEDRRGATDETTRTLHVKQPPPEDKGDPPVPSFTWSPQPPRAGGPVTFNASESKDPDGDRIIQYEWDFDHQKGNFDADHKTTRPEVAWTFQEAGPYNVALRVTDERQLSATSSVPVQVLPPPPGPPVVSFANPKEGDTIRAGPFLVSWVDEENSAESFTLFLDNVHEAEVRSQQQLHVTFSPGDHTLRLEAHGEGGRGIAWVNVTVVEEDERLEPATTETGDTDENCTTHTHEDGTTETHCAQVNDTCFLHTFGDGRVEEVCGEEADRLKERLSGSSGNASAGQGSNDAPLSPSLALIAALAVALLRRRRG